MTDYLTAPSHPDAYDDDDMLGILMLECWMYCQHQSSMDQLGWDTLQRLRGVAYGLYLAFEQGRNITPMVLAWREQPTIDLANYDEVGYELHAVAYPGHREEPAPELIARFHAPIDAFIYGLAGRIDASLLRIAPAAAEVGVDPVLGPRAVVTAGAYQVAGFILEQIEQHMVLRPAIHDEESGRQLGLGDDLAPGLFAAWKDYLARR
jgi:hypothetical protein